MAVPLAAAALALETIGLVQQSIAQKQQAKYNARVAEMQAEQARRAAEVQRYQIERRKKQLLGKQKALYSKAGVSLLGSPLEVLADTASEFDLDLALNKYNAQTAYNRGMYEAGWQRYAGRQAMTAGFLKAGGNLLMGGSKLLGSMPKKTPKYGSYEYWHSKGLASTPPYQMKSYA